MDGGVGGIQVGSENGDGDRGGCGCVILRGNNLMPWKN